MESITTSAELKNAILTLELEQNLKEKLLKEQLLLLHESFKPENLIKNALPEVTSSPYLIDNLLGTLIGLATGYISRKIAVGTSGSPIKKLLGVILQVGVTNFVAQHVDTIKIFGQYIIEHFLQKEEMDTENE